MLYVTSWWHADCIIYSSVCYLFVRVDLLPYDLITQLFKILTIETKQEKGTFHSLKTILILLFALSLSEARTFFVSHSKSF